MVKQFCAAHPCRELVTPPERYCPKHKHQAKPDRTRQEKKETDPFYGTARWQKFRDWYRTQHPLCEKCQAAGLIVPGELVDHIIELKDGGAPLDEDNVQTLCRTCHAGKTADEAKKRGRRERKPKVYSY